MIAKVYQKSKAIDRFRERMYEASDKVNQIDRRQLDKEYGDIIEFLFMPDVSGSISHGTCKKIYDLIKDVDFGSEGFRYGVLRHNDYEEFKAFLKDCYSHRKKMRWS